MKKNNNIEKLEEKVKQLEKTIDKNDKMVGRCAMVTYSAVALLGLSILVGLPIGIFASIPALTIASGAFAGLQVVNQIVGLVFGNYYNGKSVDAQEELVRLYQAQESEKSIDKTNEVAKEKTEQKTTSKTTTKTRTKKAKAEKANDDSVSVD